MPPLRSTPEAPRRAVGYVRVSDEGGRGEDLMSPEIQLTSIRDHCARNGYELVEILEDIDRTGRLWRRRKMETAVQMVEDGRAEVVVVWKVSRVSRNRKDWAIAVDRVEVAGGRLESATEPVDTATSTGRFTRGMLAELAAFESERMGESWQEVHRQRTSVGLPHSAPARLGYTYTRGSGYAVEPVGAEVVAEMYRRYSDEGIGVGELTNWLRAEGISAPKTGKPMTRYGVQYFLDSGFSAGLLYSHDPACDCRKTGGACGNRIHRPGAHTAILTAEQWAAYRRARNGRRGRAVHNLGVGSRLSGLVVCDGCDHPMQLQGSSGKSRFAYICRTRGARSVETCQSPAWARREVCEEVVGEWLPTVADLVDSFAASQPLPAVSADRRARLARAVLEADEAVVRIAVDRARGKVPPELLDRAEAELLAERATAAHELANLPTAESGGRVVEVALGLLEVWADPEIELYGINAVVRELLRVRVSRGERPRVLPLFTA